MEAGQGPPPPDLTCPVCDNLLKNAVEMPCCRTGVCRSCAIKKLVKSKKRCWLLSIPACHEATIQIDQLSPSESRRQLVEDWRTGGSLHLNPPVAEPQPVLEEEIVAEEVVVKQEPLDESEERIKGNPGLSARIAEAKAILDGVGDGGSEAVTGGGELDVGEGGGGADAEEYSENSRSVNVKQEVLVKQEAHIKQEQLTEDDGREFKREPGLCTPTSSGYWSDDSGSSGPYFGKLNWEGQGRGVVVMVTNGGEERRVPVAAIDVKCGAETGDLVEFSLGPAHTDLSGQVVRSATRVKLVEKGIPTCEQDQIRGQEALKRSLAGLQEEDCVKRARIEEVIDVRSASFGDYSDIADMAEEQLEEEEEEDAPPVEQLYPHCICAAGLPVRCPHCPFYFLEAAAERRLLPGETVTMPARIEGNQGELRRQLSRARLIPFPFKFLAQPSFDLLRRVGRGSLVGRVVGVREEEKVLATVQNLKGEGTVVKEGDVLGICQEDLAENREDHVQEVPVMASQGDLVRDDRGVYCGFVRLQGDCDFQYKLLRLHLEAELAKKFRLKHEEVTVQTRSSLWVELEARNGRSSLSKYLGKQGRLATASDVLLDVGDTKSSSNEITTSHSRRSKQESQNAYEAMLAQIDQDIACGNPVVQAPMKASMVSRVFKGVVGQQLVIPQGGSATTNLFLTDDEIPNLKCLLKARVVVSNNEEFKYYNNCYDIPEQVVTVTNGICRASRTTRPCVKVTVTNPRTGTACLKTDSPIALVKLEQAKPPAPVTQASLPPTTQLTSTAPLVAHQQPQVQQKSARPDFSAPRHLERLARKVARRWEQLVGQNLWESSLTVEERFPYFSRGKMKTPFGLNDKELNVRVGVSQSSRPVKVLDRVNGVFTCAICDVVVLDKYACQDHWYSAQHKGMMAKLQAIAGPDERVAMGRAVASELVNQWNLSPFMGLDRVVEVLQGRREPYYHCQICRTDSSLAELGPHLAAPSHVLSFLKALLPAAWARFAPSPDPSRWTEMDFTVLEQVVARVEAQHGGKRIAVASSVEQLPEVLARLPSAAAYSGKGLDSFFRSLPPAEVPQAPAAPIGPVGDASGRVAVVDAALADSIEVAAGANAEVAARLLGAFPDGLAGRWVVVSQGKDGGGLSVQPGLSKLWLDDVDKLCVRLTLVNHSASQLLVKEHVKMASVRWRE